MERRMKRTFEVDNNSIYRLLKKLVDEVAGIKECVAAYTDPLKTFVTPIPAFEPVKRKRGRPAGSKKNG